MGDGSWYSHNKVLSNSIPIVENVGGEIDKITGKKATIMALPVKVKGGDGFPTRIIATIK